MVWSQTTLLATLLASSHSFTFSSVRNVPCQHVKKYNVCSNKRKEEVRCLHRSITHLMSSTSTDNGGMVVGDTKGAALVFQDIAISRGSNRVLNNVNFRVQRNQRWGIVGPNGAGKSTLLVSGRHI